MKEYNLTSNWRNFVISKWDSKGTGIIHLKGINKYNLISNDSWCTFTPAVFVKLAFETFKLDVYRKTKQKNKTKQKQTNQKTKQPHIVNIQGKKTEEPHFGFTGIIFKCCVMVNDHIQRTASLTWFYFPFDGSNCITNVFFNEGKTHVQSDRSVLEKLKHSLISSC